MIQNIKQVESHYHSVKVLLRKLLLDINNLMEYTYLINNSTRKMLLLTHILILGNTFNE